MKLRVYDICNGLNTEALPRIIPGTVSKTRVTAALLKHQTKTMPGCVAWRRGRVCAFEPKATGPYGHCHFYDTTL